MNHGELTAKNVPSLKCVHEMKLEALLHDLLKREGRLRTARMLGVNYKTVAPNIDSGRLSVHLREALMRQLLERQATDAEERVDDGTAERTVETLMEEFFESVEEVRNELGQRLKELEGKISLVEGDPGSRLAEKPSCDVAECSQGEGALEAAADGKSQPNASRSRRMFWTTLPSVITMTPQPGD